MNATEPGSPPRGSETVLLLVPEPQTRKLMTFMLERQGYRVLEARSAADAVRTFENSDAQIDLLLTESVMPHTNGLEVAAWLRSRSPHLPVLYMAESDYVRTARRGTHQQGLVFLEKPFTLLILANRVRQVLDKPGTAVAAADT